VKLVQRKLPQRPLAQRTPALAQRKAAVPFPAAWQRLSAARPVHARVEKTHAHVSAPQGAFASVAWSSGHPLADPAISSALKERADEIQAAFAAIEPALKALAPRQFEENFATVAALHLRERLGLDVPVERFQVSWAAPLDVRGLYAHCVLATFCRLIERRLDRDFGRLFEGESAEALIQRFGFHAIDVTPCADGRLSGVIDYILRVPPAVVAFRKSYAGAMFDVEESLRHWETVELRRWREARPNPATAATRFLKIGVYHFSSVDPEHEGCAAHGSDDARAAAAVLERLQQFEKAVESTHCCEARAATLLVGVDTDTDAIRVHVPDARGQMSIERFIDNRHLYDLTRSLSREEGKGAIRETVAASIGVAMDDAATEGMRWFCGYILKNNLAQVDAVRQWHGASYADRGHTEQLIVIGDAVDDVQLRNLAFQAQMDSIEEGARDLDVGVRILSSLHEPRGLAVPVLVHIRFDPRIPGAREHALEDAQRLRAAVQSRFAPLVSRGCLEVQAVVRAGDSGTLFAVEAPPRRPASMPEGHA
jgi:carboxysome shell carbonic anhydrase